MSATTKSRDIWSHGSGTALRDLLSSALASLLFLPESEAPVYFSSPWMSDFVVFPNRLGEFQALLAPNEESTDVRLAAYLRNLACKRPVRIVTVENPTSRTFLALPALQGHPRIQYRLAPDEFHEKGILTPFFYLEGSMNLTHMGVFVRGEKVTYHPASEGNNAKISRAYMEFDRLWSLLGKDVA